MATTATINFSNEKKTGNFKYAECAYVINGSSSADLANGALTSASGSIMKGEEFVGNFYANKAADGGMKVNINDVDATMLGVLSPIVTSCLSKVAEHYA